MLFGVTDPSTAQPMAAPLRMTEEGRGCVLLPVIPSKAKPHRGIRFLFGGLRILRLRASHFAQDDGGGTGCAGG